MGFSCTFYNKLKHLYHPGTDVQSNREIYCNVGSEVVERRSGFVIRCVKKKRLGFNRSLVVLQCERDSLGGVSCWNGCGKAGVVSGH